MHNIKKTHGKQRMKQRLTNRNNNKKRKRNQKASKSKKRQTTNNKNKKLNNQQKRQTLQTSHLFPSFVQSRVVLLSSWLLFLYADQRQRDGRHRAWLQQISQWHLLKWDSQGHTLPEINSLPLKIGNLKRKFIFQPSIFRCYVAFREGTILGVKYMYQSMGFLGGMFFFKEIVCFCCPNHLMPIWKLYEFRYWNAPRTWGRHLNVIKPISEAFLPIRIDHWQVLTIIPI